MTRRALLAGVLGLLAAATGCGRKGPPKTPNPEKGDYPRKYPKPE